MHNADGRGAGRDGGAGIEVGAATGACAGDVGGDDFIEARYACWRRFVSSMTAAISFLLLAIVATRARAAQK